MLNLGFRVKMNGHTGPAHCEKSTEPAGCPPDFAVLLELETRSTFIKGSGWEDLKEGLVQVLRDRGLGHRRRGGL